MPNDEDSTGPYRSGYTTPPLSPSKTVSTVDWLSPKTPPSRKTRSCIFSYDLTATPSPSVNPQSLTKTSHLSASQLSESFKLGLYPIPLLPPPLEQPKRDGHLGCSYPFDYDSLPSSPQQRFSLILKDRHRDDDQLPETQTSLATKGTDHSTSLGAEVASAALLESRTSNTPNFNLPNLPTTPVDTHNADYNSLPLRLCQISLRHASSPLRPSQLAVRGRVPTSPRHPSHAPDRFIPPRRPPNTTKQSFELNKPEERQASESRPTGEHMTAPDPFSRRLRRSSRLNDELRSLRETHAVLTGRATLYGRQNNHMIRRRMSATRVRQISAGTVWNVGGSSAASDTVAAISNGRGGLFGSGTNAPLYTSMFLNQSDPEAELEAYEGRLALALEVNQMARIMEQPAPSNNSSDASSRSTPKSAVSTIHVWRDSSWTRDGEVAILDAPQLRDDYYCSLLAYSSDAQCLAVGLGNYVHLWSERKGVDTPESLNQLSTISATEVQHVTSLSFSSTHGGHAILAVGRADGRIALWSPFDSEPRFDATQPKPISCVAFRPISVKRQSLRDRSMTVSTEDLLVGDELGHIYFYSVEWPSETESAVFGWNGAMSLLVRMVIHTQQICGLSWSLDGEFFASGGNDNTCYLFETRKVVQNSYERTSSSDSLAARDGPNGERIYTVVPGRGRSLHVPSSQAKHRWEINAAVKAIAFCPWQHGLLAIGGGSNDRCIHFYHTISGACLATIDCAAQVTSLIWSQTRREIAATFGFAQPEHPFRIAVFAWPSCEQVVAVPWVDESRALYAISYPEGPDDRQVRDSGKHGRWRNRSKAEGCIVVAASDAAIRFHEIWGEGKKGLGGSAGLLGGSDILESLHGIDRDGGATIR